MRIATVQVASPVYVPAGQYLNGATLAASEWARKGTHTMDADFAQQHEAAGMLEIESVDGTAVVWATCCGGDHAHG